MTSVLSYADCNVADDADCYEPRLYLQEYNASCQHGVIRHYVTRRHDVTTGDDLDHDVTTAGGEFSVHLGQMRTTSTYDVCVVAYAADDVSDTLLSHRSPETCLTLSPLAERKFSPVHLYMQSMVYDLDIFGTIDTSTQRLHIFAFVVCLGPRPPDRVYVERTANGTVFVHHSPLSDEDDVIVVSRPNQVDLNVLNVSEYNCLKFDVKLCRYEYN